MVATCFFFFFPLSLFLFRHADLSLLVSLRLNFTKEKLWPEIRALTGDTEIPKVLDS